MPELLHLEASPKLSRALLKQKEAAEMGEDYTTNIDAASVAREEALLTAHR